MKTKCGPPAHVTNDNANQYLYDGEGRLCAVKNLTVGAMTGYIYDADANRVAKGSITSMSCNPAINGFQAAGDYVVGPSGEQIAELDRDPNGVMTWQHSNVWGGGQLMATYDPNGLHFHANDWLGSRRVQTDYAGVVEQTCSSLPFGDSLACSDSNATPTEHHFTGKERDTESGNDYFGARYYGSSMGRFMTPDPSTLEYADPTNPQSFNLYSYVLNNPLINVDPDGLKCFQVDSDGNLTGSSNAGDCATDANGNPTNNDIYVDDEKATNPFLDSNGDLLGYTNGSGQEVGADGNPFPNAGTLGANGFGTPLNDIQTTTADVDTQIAPSSMEFIQLVNQDNQHQIGCIAQAYGVGAPATTAFQLGQPVAGTKRFVSPGSSLGSSPISEGLSKALPFKGRFPAPVGGPGTGVPFRMTKTGNLGRAIGRWTPFVAAAADIYAAVQLWNCLGSGH